MDRFAPCVFAFFSVTMGALAPATGQTPIDTAWEQLPHYTYGQDLGPLLAIERAVIEAMGSPAVHAGTAQRLAALLLPPQTTPAARQFICLQLRQIGTPAEIPILAPLLLAPDTCEMARCAIAAIPGPAATDALRHALDSLQGESLVGVINALGARRADGCVAKFMALAEAPDEPCVRRPCARLARIADPPAVSYLRGLAAKQPMPLPTELAGCLLQVASVLVENGQREEASAIFAGLSAAAERAGTRRAAWEGRLSLEPSDRRAGTLRDWFVAGDAEQRQVAARHLRELPDDMIRELSQRIAELPDIWSVVVIEALADRQPQDLLPWVLEMVQSDKRDVRLAGVRCLGAVRDVAAVPALIDLLGMDAEVSAVAQQSLERLPREVVGPALVTALNRPDHSRADRRSPRGTQILRSD